MMSTKQDHLSIEEYAQAFEKEAHDAIKEEVIVQARYFDMVAQPLDDLLLLIDPHAGWWFGRSRGGGGGQGHCKGGTCPFLIEQPLLDPLLINPPLNAKVDAIQEVLIENSSGTHSAHPVIFWLASNQKKCMYG